MVALRLFEVLVCLHHYMEESVSRLYEKAWGFLVKPVSPIEFDQISAGAISPGAGMNNHYLVSPADKVRSVLYLR